MPSTPQERYRGRGSSCQIRVRTKNYNFASARNKRLPGRPNSVQSQSIGFLHGLRQVKADSEPGRLLQNVAVTAV